MYGFKAHEYYIIVSTMLLRGRSLTTLTKTCPLLATYPTPIAIGVEISLLL